MAVPRNKRDWIPMVGLILHRCIDEGLGCLVLLGLFVLGALTVLTWNMKSADLLQLLQSAVAGPIFATIMWLGWPVAFALMSCWFYQSRRQIRFIESVQTKGEEYRERLQRKVEQMEFELLPPENKPSPPAKKK